VVFEMTQYEKYELAVKLLKELNCPEPILSALWLFGITVHKDEEKLNQWRITSGDLIETKTRNSARLKQGIDGIVEAKHKGERCSPKKNL
jgi:hypothetical protein